MPSSNRPSAGQTPRIKTESPHLRADLQSATYFVRESDFDKTPIGYGPKIKTSHPGMFPATPQCYKVETSDNMSNRSSKKRSSRLSWLGKISNRFSMRSGSNKSNSRRSSVCSNKSNGSNKSNNNITNSLKSLVNIGKQTGNVYEVERGDFSSKSEEIIISSSGLPAKNSKTSSSVDTLVSTRTVSFDANIRQSIPNRDDIDELVEKSKFDFAHDVVTEMKSKIESAMDVSEPTKSVNGKKLSPNLNARTFYGSMQKTTSAESSATTIASAATSDGKKYQPDVLKLLIRHNLLNATPALNNELSGNDKHSTFLGARNILFGMCVFSHVRFIFSLAAFVVNLKERHYYLAWNNGQCDQSGHRTIAADIAMLEKNGKFEIAREYEYFHYVAFGPGQLVEYIIDMILLLLLVILPYKMLRTDFFESTKTGTTPGNCAAKNSDVRRSRRLLVFYYHLTRVYAAFLAMCFLFNFARDADLKSHAKELLREIDEIDRRGVDDNEITTANGVGEIVAQKVTELHETLTGTTASPEKDSQASVPLSSQRPKSPRTLLDTLSNMRIVIDKGEGGADLGRYTGLFVYFFHISCYLGLCYAAYKFLREFDMHMLRRKAAAEERGYVKSKKRNVVEVGNESKIGQQFVVTVEKSSDKAPELALNFDVTPSTMASPGDGKRGFHDIADGPDSSHAEKKTGTSDADDVVLPKLERKISPKMENYEGQLPFVRGGAPTMQ